MINILIIHYNTPFLTECLVKSINKFVPDSTIYIFDNSDKEPFVYRQDNIIYLDNTKGRYINFSEWLSKYPNRVYSSAKNNNYASAKHSISIQKCIEIIDDNFLLLDSDVLLKKNIFSVPNDEYLYVGEIQKYNGINRVLPYFLYLNVNMMKKNNIKFFNEKYMHGLCSAPQGDMYDTGAGFYEVTKNLPKQIINIFSYIEHYAAGSWYKLISHKKNETPEQWLLHNRSLWQIN